MAFNVQELRQGQLNKECEIFVEKQKRRELLQELSYIKMSRIGMIARTVFMDGAPFFRRN
ncbi:MAG: hypothetical protein NT022_00290 [Deltaproteobacteria bacterium]|nr:hypothetical protein [Deltaproteobacteria bacterium]